jgi:SAM-dependent methyltransferase
MVTQTHSQPVRTADQLKQHYEIEKALADRLRAADRAERQRLYASLYDELFQRVPLHPRLIRKTTPEIKRQHVGAQLKLLLPLVDRSVRFLELGPGDCSLSFVLAQYVKHVSAVDVSERITRSMSRPINFELILSDGCSIPVPPGSIDLAYSYQLMEHLHPDDALEQLQNIYNALAPGGQYLCITPNRLSGPHDISKFFDATATGLHLKEYTARELSRLFYRVGFRSLQIILGGHGRFVWLPAELFSPVERAAAAIPLAQRRRWFNRAPLTAFFGDIRLIGAKPG